MRKATEPEAKAASIHRAAAAEGAKRNTRSIYKAMKYYLPYSDMTGYKGGKKEKRATRTTRKRNFRGRRRTNNRRHRRNVKK
jgi:hypothetical protein